MKQSPFKPTNPEITRQRRLARKAKRLQREANQTACSPFMSEQGGDKKRSAAAIAGKRRKTVRRAKTLALETALKLEVRERDNYTCRWPKCRYRDKHIPVHHINERSQRPDLKYNRDNCLCLCPGHHDYAHHTMRGRNEARRLGILGGQTYEAAKKEKLINGYQQKNNRGDREAST